MRLWAMTGILLGLGFARYADAATLELDASRPGCGGYTSGVGTCDVGDGIGSIDVTWQLQAAESLNGYDLVVHWDPNEVILAAASQLYPDTGAPLPWDSEPNAPGDSAVVLSLTPATTTSLFRLTFTIQSLIHDEQADIWWTANGNGLSPGSVVLSNPSGSGVDLIAPSAVPTLMPLPLITLALLLAVSARSRPPPHPPAGGRRHSGPEGYRRRSSRLGM